MKSLSADVDGDFSTESDCNQEITPGLGLGYGLGLRSQHFSHVLEHWPERVDWFEVITENVLDNYGWARHVLEQIRARYPVAFHGVSLSIGSTDPLGMAYLRQLKKLCDDIQPVAVSDHLCWTGFGGINTHDLLPLPLTTQCLKHVIERVCRVQDVLQRPLLLENPSTYLEFTESTMPEWEFLSELSQQSGCYLLLDVNNIVVSAKNHQFEPLDYLTAIPVEKVAQIHIAGHDASGDYVIDTHDRPVCAEVWTLYQQAIARFGPIATLLEWDANIPEFSLLEGELDKARRAAASCSDMTGPASLLEPAVQTTAMPSSDPDRNPISNPVSFLYGASQ